MTLDRFIEAICVAGFLAAIGYGGGRLLGAVLASMMRKKPANLSLRDTIERRSILERNLAARIGERRKALAELDRSFRQLVSRRQQADAARTEAEACPDRIVRTVGQEVKGTELFLALVVNKYVRAEGGKAAVDPAWALPQQIEVWAKSLADARGELDRRYPESQGYKVTSMVDGAAARG